MALRFNQPRRSFTPRTSTAGVPLRLVSLAVGLALVAMFMQVVQSPSTREKLALLFGDAAPVAEVTDNGDAPPPARLESIDESLLDEVEDNTPFRDAESTAWFHLLSVVGDATDEQLEQASRGPIVYAQLTTQPDVYRGHVIDLKGNARRVESITPAENDLGIDELYRIILQPERDALRPFTIYSRELPEGWAVGRELPNDGEMRVRAVFFKNWPHNTERGISLSPTFLARTVTPIAYSTPAVHARPTRPLWQIVAMAAVVAVVLVAWVGLRRVDLGRRRYTANADEVAEELSSLETKE